VSRFYVENFGCRATQADGAAIERQFRDLGLDASEGCLSADYVIFNTCAVTGAAEKDARAAIRRLRRTNPSARVIVTGCYAQRAPQEVAELPGVDFVIGNSHKHNLARIVLDKKSEKDSCHSGFFPVSVLTARAALSSEILVSDIFAHTELVAAPVFDSSNERTRPNLKVQDGCNNRCSFCIIPSVRGRSRSLPLDEVVREVDQLVGAGYREVVMSGINLGRWGRDLGGTEVPGDGRPRPHNFESMVRAILDRTALEKIRISSVEPMDWSDALIRLMADSPRIAKHAHVPMQSGSDSVLRRMHRKYRPWHYREKIKKIRAAMPDAAIGADVMVGFPGESDSEFEETRRMIEALPFTYLHVFTFSARPGTSAATMSNQIAPAVARGRSQILRELVTEKKQTFTQSCVGRSLAAITLNLALKNENGIWTEALTDNYLKMRLRGKHTPNRWLNVRVEDVQNGELIGVVDLTGEQSGKLAHPVQSDCTVSGPLLTTANRDKMLPHSNAGNSLI